jgi:hypothetical protein
MDDIKAQKNGEGAALELAAGMRKRNKRKSQALAMLSLVVIAVGVPGRKALVATRSGSRLT